LGLGSDAPVASLDPRLGVVAACRRAAPGDPPWQAEEALSVEQALEGYTVTAAALGRRADLGRIAVGLRADLVAFDDVLDDPVDSWRDAQVWMTMVDGSVVYSL
jgi:predicted amidohydrolase YtcJ